MREVLVILCLRVKEGDVRRNRPLNCNGWAAGRGRRDAKLEISKNRGKNAASLGVYLLFHPSARALSERKEGEGKQKLGVRVRTRRRRKQMFQSCSKIVQSLHSFKLGSLFGNNPTPVSF